MKKLSLIAGSTLLLGSLSCSVSAVDQGLIEARAESFTGMGAAVRFQNYGNYWNTEEVKAIGPNSTWRLPRNTKDLSDFSYTYEGVTYSYDDFINRNRTNALLVMKDGAIVHEAYFNGSDEQTRFISMSAGKSITSTLLGAALEDGYIKSLDDNVADYVPKLVGSGYDGASIRDLLQMASGTNLNEDYDADPEGAMIYFDCVYRTWFAEEIRFSDCAAGLESKYQPGTHFNYNTFDSLVLGKLIENATGQRFHKYFEQRMWKPMGMESDMTMIMDSAGPDRESLSGGGYLMTLRDFGRFGQMMLNKGQANGSQIVSEAWVEEATKADPNKPFLQVGQVEDFGNLTGYNHQWWLFPNDEYSAEGVFGQYIYAMPQSNMVVVKLSYWKDAWTGEDSREAMAFFHALEAYLK